MYMGIFDFIKNMRVKKEKEISVNEAMHSVRQAAQASNYNQASIKAFHALTAIGEIYTENKREIYNTAREYASTLATNVDGITLEELKPIIDNFEIAKYSEFEVSYENYKTVEETLNGLVEKLKKQDTTKKPKAGAKGKRVRKRPPPKRKPRKRKVTGARTKK